jgi:hypothetical protein
MEFFFFLLEAIVSALLLTIASIIVLRRKDEFRSVALPLYASSICAIAGLVLTLFAAPYMLSVRTMNDNPELLLQTFNNFHYWGFFRAIAQVLSFCFCVWSIGKVFELKKEV